MAKTPKNVAKIGTVIGRIVMSVGLVAFIAVIGESQSPSATSGTSTADPPTVPRRLASGGELGLSKVPEFPNVGAAGDMIGFSHCDNAGTQTITLVHTEKSWIAVYHIDRSGTLRLVSSRPIDADFSLQLNATSPLPEQIRQIGGR